MAAFKIIRFPMNVMPARPTNVWGDRRSDTRAHGEVVFCSVHAPREPEGIDRDPKVGR
jgi:hypothetical protein